MGKIRVKTIGDEELERQQAEGTKKRSDAKKAEKQATDTSADETGEEATPEKKDKKNYKVKKQTSGKVRSKPYLEKVKLVDPKKNYSLSEALKLLPELHLASFDETVEIHINTVSTGVSGSVTLPHGTGKKMRVVIAEGSDAKSLEELVKKVEGGTIDFDILIATPDAMPKLAKIARVLGPRGLMPNPKNGTVTQNPTEAAKKYEGGQINFKTEAKFPLLHISVGKMSFGDKKLEENIKTILSSIGSKNVKDATLKSTMSPGIKIDTSNLK